VTRLVEQLLTLARVDPESDKKDFESVNLVAVAVRVISEYAQSAVQKEIDLGLEDESSGNLDGYPEALEVLLRNLVDNAVKYTQKAAGWMFRSGRVVPVYCLWSVILALALMPI